MSWESCIILLNTDSTRSCYAGDCVTGTVVLEFKKEQKVDNISFKVLGISKAQWTRSSPTIPYIKIYSEKRTIFQYEIDVFSDINGKKVKPGIQTFHFYFRIPSNAPSSFKSHIAAVDYVIRVQGKPKCFLSNLKTTQFTVLGNVNINHMPDYLEPAFVEKQKSFWPSGSFKLCFKTYKGFSPNQYAPFEAIIINENKVTISKINVSLIQKLKYTVSSGYAEDEKKIFRVVHKKFSNTLTERCSFGMEIPRIEPSSIYLTDPMIDISYILRVEVVFSLHTSLYEDIAVIISTVPVLHNDFEEKEYIYN
ncbi:arrestin domain-containing protein 2-like [Phthorimaea operculella]|nr:arrestin domain-containing protein 2-like [Phthorimaea operculella]